MLAGCGTCQNLASDKRPFGGVSWDANYALHGRGTGYLEDELFRPIAALDSPISLAGDIVTLPITLYATADRRFRAAFEEAKSPWPERTPRHPPPQNEPSAPAAESE